MGGDIWADSRVLLNHIGHYEFKGDLAALERKGLKRVDVNSPEGKAAVEAHCRQLAIELATLVPGATVTALRPGVVDTPALRKIPGSQDWIDVVMKKHPGKRLTTPDDVGRAIVALSAPGMNWVTGNTITIDGGEQIAGG
jgi:NAD(P)-dependent dehydrogenase (short-subunit alcohol dehydrogenase family)